MEYIVITLLAIAATTCLVYLLANKVFAVRLRLKSLVLCAACALFLSLVLPRIVVSFTGLAGTIAFLALFAVIFAYFVAYYDDPKDLQPAGNGPPATPPQLSDEPPTAADVEPLVYLAAQGRAQPIGEPAMSSPVDATEPESESLAEPESDYEPEVVPELGILLESFTAAELAPAPEPPEAFLSGEESEQLAAGAEDAIAPETETELDFEPATATAVLPELPPEQKVAAETVIVATPAQPQEASAALETDLPQAADDQAIGLDLEIELNLIAGPVVNAESEPDDEINISLSPALSLDGPSPVPVAHADETASGLEAEAESLATLTLAGPDDETVNPLPETNAAQPESSTEEEGEGSAAATAEEEPIVEEPEVTLAAEPVSNSLEDLLDFAFSQKGRQNLPLALDTFRQAYKLYRDSEAGPLLVIEIAGLLKTKGAYDEAVMVLSDGRGLAALQQNPLLDQEFVNTIAYLRIVKNTLMQNRIGFVPFQRIPADIVKEIDEEFREWRNFA